MTDDFQKFIFYYGEVETGAAVKKCYLLGFHIVYEPLVLH